MSAIDRSGAEDFCLERMFAYKNHMNDIVSQKRDPIAPPEPFSHAVSRLLAPHSRKECKQCRDWAVGSFSKRSQRARNIDTYASDDFRAQGTV